MKLLCHCWFCAVYFQSGSLLLGKNLLHRSTGLNYSGNTCILHATIIRVDLACAVAVSNLSLPWFTACRVVWHATLFIGSEVREDKWQTQMLRFGHGGGGQKVPGLGKCVDSGENWGCGLVLAIPTRAVSLKLKFKLLLKINLHLKATFILWPTLNALLREGRFCW